MREVAPHELADTWVEVGPWIESALAYGQGDESSLDILISLARGQYTLFVSPQVAAVVQLVRQPRQSVLVVLYVGGTSLDACKQSYEFAKELCRSRKIDVLRIWGREGWQRALNMQRVGVILQESI